MAEQVILPCPQCRGIDLECDSTLSNDFGTVWCVVCCDCGVSGPTSKLRELCVAGWNNLPREEPWIPVAEGLPEYEESRNATYDVWSTAGHWLDCLSLNGVFETRQGEQIPQATHYRKHRTPKGPR